MGLNEMNKARNLRAFIDILYRMIHADKLLDVLDLLTHLLNQHFQLDGGGGDFGIDRLGCQGVGFAV